MKLTYGALDLTATPFLVEFGLDPGAPENEVVALPFLLQDGEIELSSRASNRTLQFNVLIEGASLTVLATAEASLLAESEKVLNTITVDPEDGAPVAVYEVFRGQVSLVRDDEWERSRMRRYTVTVRAYPFTRSATQTITAALPATGSTTTLLDACSATTGWTGFVDGGSVSPATSGGAVTLTATVTTDAAHTMELRKTFAATTTSTKYLVVDWKPPSGWSDNVGLTAIGDGVSLPLLFEGPSPTSGYVRSMFMVAASSLAITRLVYPGYAKAGSPPSAVFSVDNVAVSDVNPTFGSGRQQARSLTVSGSARTRGSLAIESTTAALGNGTLVYVYAADASTNGYSPPLRQFRVSGNTVTSDSAMVSGASEPLNGAMVVFRVPIGLFPRGSYLLMARLATSGGGTPNIVQSSATIVGAGAVDAPPATGTVVTTTTAYQTFTLGRLLLPTIDLDPASASAGAFMFLGIQATTACTYDEIWLFNTSIGSLTQVNCGTGAGSVGGAARRLFIEPPAVNDARPTIRVGHSADRSDSYYPAGLTTSLSAWGIPEFKPPQANVFLVTPNATDATATLRHFPRWHTNPAS